MREDAPFALCLTHDIDRPFKGYRSLYYALRDRPGYHLKTAMRRDNPYWQFDTVMALEDELGVRSAFYVLKEPHLLALDPREWVRPINWVQHLGRYDPTDGPVAEAIGRLDDGGWEIGLHGSYHSQLNPDLLIQEKEALERTVGHPVRGVRQHYLRMVRPDTWQFQADAGLAYDTSLGSGTTFGFKSGHSPFQPFDDEFTVFPLTMMDQAVMNAAPSRAAVWDACRAVLDEAAERGAVITIDWHQRVFNDREFPGYGDIYRRIVEYAQAAGAWVGPPGTLYDELVGHPRIELV